MSASGFNLSNLQDARLALLATSQLPAWLWSTDATRIVWANPIGAAIFGASTSAAIGAQKFDAADPAAAQIARLATTLARDASPRLEQLRGFGVELGRTLTCACSHIMLRDGTPALLVVATERAGPELTLSERVQRLLAGNDEPVAVYSAVGQLLCATQSAHAYLGGAPSLAALGAQALAATALASGHATGNVGDDPVSIDRLGGETATVLVVNFSAQEKIRKPIELLPTESAAQEPAAAATGPALRTTPATAIEAGCASSHSESPPSPERRAPVERRHPLRFVWQSDEQGRFTLGSDEFIELMGARTAAMIGRPWADMATELALDPEGQIARAIATRDTWSGLTVSWPVDEGKDRLPVELSGLPVFDRERIFRGYRGFGVCRDVARLSALAIARQASMTCSEQPPAQTAASAPKTRPVFAMEVPGKNVVPFPSGAAEVMAPALTPVEHMAFRELSRKLTQGLAAAGVEPDVRNANRTMREYGVAVEETHIAEAASDARPMLDRIPVGILIYRLNALLYANPVFLQWSGHRTLEGLIEAGGLDELFIEPISAAAAGNDQSVTLRIDRRDKVALKGELINIDWEGEPAHALVTALKEREPDKLEPLQGEIAELKSILDAASDGVILIDRQGTILSASRSAQALFDYESHQLAGTAFTELLAPESADIARDYLNDVVDNGRAARRGREIIGRVREGRPIPLSVTIAPIGDGREKLCVAFRDITQWKQSEQELIDAKHRAETASSAKSDFLAKISHEIRTPLNSIIGFSEVMMAEQFGLIGNERYREYLKDIHASGGHLLSLINDLLDLSKIEAGKLQLTFTGVALNDLTRQCVAIMQPQANRERVIIRTALAPALPQVVADARSVRQIVLNLLSNSLKFTAAGGQVIVSTALNDDGGVVLRVRDTGVGMTEKDIVTALEPFRQLATSPRGGTGLGLPLTKAMAEANRAKFLLTSAPKEGTLVEITFPASSIPAG
jgi:PAS domain S-box-containing protein